MDINEEKLKEFIISRIKKKSNFSNLHLDEIDDNFSFITSGLFDSMDFLNLMTDVEAAFKITIDFSDADPEEFTVLKGFIKCCLSDKEFHPN